MSYLLARADARSIPLADGSVQCCVTSAPYWGLRDYGYPEQIGLEETPVAFVKQLVAVCREAKRILRPDGTFWLNLGDSYANDSKWGGKSSKKNQTSHAGGYSGQRAKRDTGLRPKNLSGMPWRVALALQDDGWYLRSDIIWSKPNALPEPVLDRPSKSHEYLFLLAKSERYFYDTDAIRVPIKETSLDRAQYNFGDHYAQGAVDPRGYRGNGLATKQHIPGAEQDGLGVGYQMPAKWLNPSGRNCRTVWEIATEACPIPHYAAFPRALVEPCIKAGTSDKGCCPACRAPWRRMTQKSYARSRAHGAGSVVGHHYSTGNNNWDGMPRLEKRVETVGWRPGCECDAGDPVPCIVADPFAGSGTVVVVAEALGRIGIGFDRSAQYLSQARCRIDHPHASIPRGGREESHPLFEQQRA